MKSVHWSPSRPDAPGPSPSPALFLRRPQHAHDHDAAAVGISGLASELASTAKHQRDAPPPETTEKPPLLMRQTVRERLWRRDVEPAGRTGPRAY